MLTGLSFSALSSQASALGRVPKGGLEPPRAYAHCALNAARLPIPPLRRSLEEYTTCVARSTQRTLLAVGVRSNLRPHPASDARRRRRPAQAIIDDQGLRATDRKGLDRAQQARSIRL